MIARPRLLERLAHARGRRCVVLEGPAGCGKTSLLTVWRRELVAADVDVAWLALDAADDDPARFAEALLAGLVRVDPALVREAAVLAGRGSADEAIEGLVISLVRAIAAHRRELVIVFDDAHHLRDAQVVKVLQLMLDYGPENLQCALATRGALAVALGRLRAQQQLAELGVEDLRFTPAESAQLAAGILGKIDEREAHALHRRTDGWAAGIRLLCLDLRRGAARRPAADTPVHDGQTFTRYFEEVLGKLPPASVEFLTRIALPEHFSPELCAALTGQSADAPACEQHLAGLERQGLFIVPAGPRYPDGWSRLHPLQRSVLAARLDAWPPGRRQSLHATAWHFFAARGMTYDAVRHALLAGAMDEAAALVESRGTDLFVHGELRRLVGLVRLLPPEAVQRRPGLRLWLAWVELFEQRLPECGRSIAQLEYDLADAPPAVRYRLALLRGLHAVQCEDMAAAVAAAPELSTPPPDADVIALSGCSHFLTWLHLYRGEYEQARRIQLEQDPPTVDGQVLYGTTIGLLAGRCMVGLAHAVEGQMIRAERIYRDVLFEAERRGPGCADAGALAAALLGEVLYELNDAAGALDLLEPRLEVLERVSIPDSRVRLMLVLARARWLAGRPLDAFDYLEQVQAHGERTGLDRMQAYALHEQIHFRVRLGELDRARALMAELDVLDTRHAGAETGAVSEIRVTAERARIHIWLREGELDLALARLDALAGLCRRRGRVRRLPYLHLQSAAALRQLGRHEEARAHVREALRQGHGLGLVRTLLDAHDDVRVMVQEAIRDHTLDPVLLFYAERLEAAAREPDGGASPLARPARPGLEVLSPREAEIVRLLLQNLPNKKIARSLDLSLDTVKWHLKNVYSKLGADGRDDVVARLQH